jgi:hypothetical protein
MLVDRSSLTKKKMPLLSKEEHWKRFWKSAPTREGKQYRTKEEIAEFRRKMLKVEKRESALAESESQSEATKQNEEEKLKYRKRLKRMKRK